MTTRNEYDVFVKMDTRNNMWAVKILKKTQDPTANLRPSYTNSNIKTRKAAISDGYRVLDAWQEQKDYENKEWELV